MQAACAHTRPCSPYSHTHTPPHLSHAYIPPHHRSKTPIPTGRSTWTPMRWTRLRLSGSSSSLTGCTGGFVGRGEGGLSGGAAAAEGCGISGSVGCVRGSSDDHLNTSSHVAARALRPPYAPRPPDAPRAPPNAIPAPTATSTATTLRAR